MGHFQKNLLHQHHFRILLPSSLLASVGCATPNTGENREETNAKAPETTQYNAQETTLRIQKLLADNGTTLTDDLINNVSPYDEKIKKKLRDIEQCKISINDIDKSSWDFTALHTVVLCMTTPSTTAECDCIVNILMNKGANPNLRDRHGRTPLEIAVDLSCATVVGVLVGRGAITTENTWMHKPLLEHAKEHAQVLRSGRDRDAAQAIVKILERAQQ